MISKTEQRLRASRNAYRQRAVEERMKRKSLEVRNAELEQRIHEMEAVSAFSRRKNRHMWYVVQAAVGVMLLIGGAWFKSVTTDKLPENPIKQASQPRETLVADRVYHEMASRIYPQLGCKECGATEAKSEDHVLASVKMTNGNTGCSATVVGDPVNFRKYKKVLVVSAGHCVSGNVGKNATFYNPDGKTSFEATLIAFNRHLDASIFAADSDKVLGAVFMADPGDWDQSAKFSSCNYPQASGGPNYKFCTYAGMSSREGADEGYLFNIDEVSAEHKGFFSSGGSGGGMFVQEKGSAQWLYFGDTTHGGDGTVICTPKHSELYQWMAEAAPCNDDNCPYCRKRPKCPPRQPHDPIDPNNPNPNTPPWYNPNIPVDPGNAAPAPPPPGDKPPAVPVPPPVAPVDTKAIDDLKAKIKNLEDALTAISSRPGTPGKDGANGKDGSQGPAGKDGAAPAVDYAAIQAKVESIVQAKVDALAASGQLKGKDGQSPTIDVNAITQQVMGKLPPIELVFDPSDPASRAKVKLGESVTIPPVMFEIFKDGKGSTNSKPLGKALSLEFSTK